MVDKKEQYKNKILKSLKTDYYATIIMVIIISTTSYFTPLVFSNVLNPSVDIKIIHYQQIFMGTCFTLMFGGLYVSSFWRNRKFSKQVLKYIENKTFDELEHIYMDEHEIGLIKCIWGSKGKHKYFLPTDEEYKKVNYKLVEKFVSTELEAIEKGYLRYK